MLRVLARGSHFGVHMVVYSIKMKANLHTNDMTLPYLLLLKELNLFQIFAPIGHIASSAFTRIEQNIFFIYWKILFMFEVYFGYIYPLLPPSRYPCPSQCLPSPIQLHVILKVTHQGQLAPPICECLKGHPLEYRQSSNEKSHSPSLSSHQLSSAPQPGGAAGTPIFFMLQFLTLDLVEVMFEHLQKRAGWWYFEFIVIDCENTESHKCTAKMAEIHFRNLWKFCSNPKLKFTEWFFF